MPAPQEQDQHRLPSIWPSGPTAVTSYFDWLGNLVHVYTVGAFHRNVRIIATSIVETHRARVDPASLSDRWPVATGDDYTVYDYLPLRRPSSSTSPQLRELIALLKPTQGMSLGDLAIRMLRLIDEKVRLRKRNDHQRPPVLSDHGCAATGPLVAVSPGIYRTHLAWSAHVGRPATSPARYGHCGRMVYDAGGNTSAPRQTTPGANCCFPSVGWIARPASTPPTTPSPATPLSPVTPSAATTAMSPPTAASSAATPMKRCRSHVQTERLTSIPAQLAAERLQTLPIPCFTAHDIQREAKRLFEEQQQQQQQ